MTNVEELKKLGAKITGAEVDGDTIAEVLSNIAEGYGSTEVRYQDDKKITKEFASDEVDFATGSATITVDLTDLTVVGFGGTAKITYVDGDVTTVKQFVVGGSEVSASIEGATLTFSATDSTSKATKLEVNYFVESEE